MVFKNKKRLFYISHIHIVLQFHQIVILRKQLCTRSYYYLCKYMKLLPAISILTFGLFCPHIKSQNSIPTQPPQAFQVRTVQSDSLGFIATQALQGQLIDPSPSKPLYTRQLIAPTALISVGVLGLTNGWMRKMNRTIAEKIGSSSSSHIHIDDFTRFLPITAVFALPIIQLRPRHTLRERLAVTLTATALTCATIWSLKNIVHANRPNLSDNHSFPSGHTAFAFMGAEILRAEYWDISPWIGITGYAVAIGTGYLRMHNNAHYLTDIMAGAGIGIATARIAYWLLPWERRLLRWDKHKATTMIVPYASLKSFGISYSMSF